MTRPATYLSLRGWDEEGKAWHDMVLIGHSMGGLITRLMITPSSAHCGAIRQRVVAERDTELEDYLRNLASFDPLPFVRRAVFMGTPQAGAGMADRQDR